MAPYPVYWLGGSFEGLQITEAARDPGGASSIQYGDCLEGGQGVCVPPLRVVTSPDNSFLPGGSAPRATAEIRGVTAVVALGGRVIEIPTGRVVVDIYARNPQRRRRRGPGDRADQRRTARRTHRCRPHCPTAASPPSRFRSSCPRRIRRLR